jgi:hypothetical protein
MGTKVTRRSYNHICPARWSLMRWVTTARMVYMMVRQRPIHQPLEECEEMDQYIS